MPSFTGLILLLLCCGCIPAAAAERVRERNLEGFNSSESLHVAVVPAGGLKDFFRGTTRLVANLGPNKYLVAGLRRVPSEDNDVEPWGNYLKHDARSTFRGGAHEKDNHWTLRVRVLPGGKRSKPILPRFVHSKVLSEDLLVVSGPEPALNETLRLLSKQTAVIWIERKPAYLKFNFQAMRTLHGAGVDLVPHLGGAGGEIVTVVDTGVDVRHCMFADDAKEHAPPPQYLLDRKVLDLSSREPTHAKITAYLAVRAHHGFRSVTTDYTDEENGHGTHVAGSAVGGSVCAGEEAAREVSDAKLIFVDVGVTGEEFLTIPSDLRPLLQTAYDAGSRIVTCSWGSEYNGYSLDSYFFDLFVYLNDDLTVTIANGNSGRDGAGTVGSPATAKNVISVGASAVNYEAWRTASVTADWWEARHSPLSPLEIKGRSWLFSEDNLMDFSSRGPTLDGRIKPDLVVPGSMIVSSRSRGKSREELLYMQGTSMATPLLARVVSQVRHRLRASHHLEAPSAALIKALLVNSARDLKGVLGLAYKGEALKGYPAGGGAPGLMGQGFGRVDLGEFWGGKLDFLDREEISAERQYCFEAASRGQVSITIVWTDPPSFPGNDRDLVNDLDLRVVVWSKGSTSFKENPKRIILGNHGTLPDRLNPTERVRFLADEGDIVRVLVNLPFESVDAKQHYSIVWTGSHLRRQSHCRARCTLWDPEHTCSVPGVEAGVVACDPATLTYETACRPVTCARGYAIIEGTCRPTGGSGGAPCDVKSDPLALGLGRLLKDGETCVPVACQPGYAVAGGACRCYAHLPCLAGGQGLSFTPCGDDDGAQEGALSPCTRVGSIFATLAENAPPERFVRVQLTAASVVGFGGVCVLLATCLSVGILQLSRRESDILQKRALDEFGGRVGWNIREAAPDRQAIVSRNIKKRNAPAQRRWGAAAASMV